jgi:acyl transferase domain-containing protein/NADPH:quinone reductase-like Zn-dependent oxidoreductase/NADP-dependent 3-hydroxy acid dehydrogenase YdfG/acyl carrier protein
LRASRTAVFVGVSNTDYGLLQRFEPGVADIQAGTGTALSIVANRVSNLLDLGGPSMGIDTACSSSLVALDAACRSLREGTAGLAFAGGVNILLDPRMFMTFCRAHMLSPAGRIAAFDADADGFVRGEGAGIVLLKRLQDAQRDGDRIYAVIKATAVNQDGATDSITAPNPAAQKAMMQAALAQAGVKAADIAYVEAHGTGTPLGDPVEASAIGAVFGQVERDGAVLIGSVKCNIGHLEPAAGIAGLIKAALILEKREVPPSINFVTPNPRIAFDALNIEVAGRAAPLGSDAHALVNSFGFGGTNACAILARGADNRAKVVRLVRAPAQSERLMPVPLSAPTPEHLAAYARVLAEALADGTLAGIALDKIGAALIRRHSQFGHRAVILARDAADLAEKLTALADGREWPKHDKNEPPAIVTGRGKRTGKLAFTCTGQGGQFWNMGRDFLEAQPVFRRFVEEFDALFEPLAGWSVKEALSASEHGSRLHDPAITPAAMFALQAGLAEVWKSAGITPDIAIGHSFGEVTAAYLGGAIALTDVAHLVNHRGLIRGHIDRVGGMAAIGMGAEALAPFLPADGSIEIGAYNAPIMVTVSGERAAIEDLIARLNAHDPNILARMLELDFAWHSSWLEPGKQIFRDAVGDRPWQAPRITVVSTVTGQPETRFDTDYWWRNLRYPVRFDRAVDCALDLGADAFVELGPSRTLSSPTAGCAAAKGRDVLAVTTLQRGQNNFDSFNAALAELYVAGRAVDWGALFAAGDEHVALPPMPWLDQPLWHAPEEAGRALHRQVTHVLLGAREAEPGFAWRSEVSLAGLPVLGDHRIMDSCVLPGAAMLSMLRAAAAEIFGAQAVELSDVRLPEALFIGADDRVILRTQYDAERSRIRIHSRLKGAPAQWTLRAEARLYARGDGLSLVAAPRQDEGLEIVDIADFYQLAKANGYGFGPAFQGLRRIECGTNALRAVAALPFASAIDDASLDPRLLDSCLQAIIAALAGTVSGPLLPERIDRILIGGQVGQAAQISVESERSTEDGHGIFALSIADASGKPCVRIEGLHARMIATRGAQDRRAPVIIVEEMVESAPTPTLPTGPWLVLGDGVHADALVSTLTVSERVVSQEADPAAFKEAVAARNIVYALPLDLATDVDWPTAAAVTEDVTRLIEFGKTLIRCVPAATVWILTRNARSVAPGETRDAGGLAQSALIGAARTLAIECPDVKFRLVDLDRATLARPDWPDIVLAAGNASEAAIRDGRILAPRLQARAPEDMPPPRRKPAALPAGADFVLRQEGPRSIDALVWRESRKRPPQAGEVCIRVEAAGLNFRDVMAASGLLPKDAESGDAAAALGLEFAGVVESVGAGADPKPGARVLGMARGSLRRYLTVPADDVYPVPAALGDAEAASVPSVYLTAHYALSHLGRLARGEKVLIHSGAGGLGLAAIALAMRMGAEVLATAGSAGKRDHLTSLGVRHVFDSRSLAFADDVMRATGGKGVDMVLNALPGAFIDKGLACLAPYGRFIELGKRDVYEDRAVGLKALRRNISLHVVDVAALLAERPALARRLMGEILALFGSGAIAPPPVKVFPAGRAAEAFRHFSQGRHIGKIALDLRDPDVQVASAHDGAFPLESSGTYLVTGGLSGFGFAIGKRLAEAGAGRVVLASRSGRASDDVNAAIARLRADGADVVTLALDVGDAPAVAAAIRAIAVGEMPLKGVIHAAVTYADAELEQMSDAKIEAVMRTKVAGGLNLTQGVIDAGVKLDVFLSLSSLAQVLGWRGQSNYAAANAFLEGLARAQRMRGIPGRCLNLGMLGEAGFVARSEAMTGYLQSAGWLPLSNEQALAAVALALAAEQPVLTYAAADWRRLRASEAAIAAGGRLDALASQAGEGAAALGLAQTAAVERPATAMRIVCEQVAAVLRLDPAGIDAGARLGDLGLDSLSSFELWNRIEMASAMSIPLPRFTEAATVDALAKLLCALAGEALRVKSAEASSAQAAGHDEELPGQTMALLPRERWAAAMRSARMTSHHGRRALETSLAVTVEPAGDDGALGAAWATVAQRHALPEALDKTVAAHFTEAAERPLDDVTSARLTCAQAGRATLLALRGSRALLDRWSVALLMQELLEALAGAPARRQGDDRWEGVRRREFAQLTGQHYLRHKIFWAEMLKDAPPAVYFARRNRALAPVGFGLNRGPTVRLQVSFARDAATTEAELLLDYMQSLGDATGASEMMVACAYSGRESDAARKLVGPLATALPLTCRLQGARDALAQRLARDLQHAKAHAAFDLAACEETFGAGWRAGSIVPLQFGFSYRDDSILPPALLAIPTAHFGSLTAYPGNDTDTIANDIRLALSLTGDVAYAELAYDADAVEAEFAKAVLEAFLKRRLPLHRRPPQPARG